MNHSLCGFPAITWRRVEILESFFSFLYFNTVNWPLAIVLVFHCHASKSEQAILAVNSLKQLL